MPEKPHLRVVVCLSLALAAAPLALATLSCSKTKDGERASGVDAAPARPARDTAAPARRPTERAVRAEATIERLDEKEVVFRLADGTSLTVERARVRLPEEPRPANRRKRAGDGGVKTAAVTPAFPALAVGQTHSLTVRYDAEGKLLNVRIRRPQDGKDRAR